MDVSPKGDPPGFVKVLDEHTLAVPDRLGNHRGDTKLKAKLTGTGLARWSVAHR